MMHLTPREKECCELASIGMTNEQIAEQLKLQTRTVDFHLWRAFAKLGISRRIQLVGKSIGGELQLRPVEEKPPKPPKKWHRVTETIKVGEQYGCYEVLKFLGYRHFKNGAKSPHWLCRCTLCGREKSLARTCLIDIPSKRCWHCNLPIARKNLFTKTFYGR